MADSFSHRESAPSSTAWLLTFTDLVALMLTFFVMLFSMSSVKVDRWKEMIDALSTTFNPASTTTTEAPTAQYNISSVFRRRAINVDYLSAVLREKITRDPVLAESRLVLLEDRVIISLPGRLFFLPGGARLTKKAGEALFSLGGALRQVDNELGVNAYFTSAGAKPAGYASDWELSLARAIAVTNELKRAGYTKEIVAYGFADSQKSYLAGFAAAAREKLAQRVDIVILSESGAI